MGGGGGGRNRVLPGSAQTILQPGRVKLGNSLRRDSTKGEMSLWDAVTVSLFHCTMMIDESKSVQSFFNVFFYFSTKFWFPRWAAFKEKRLCELLYLCLHCFRLAKEVGVYRLWKNYWTIFTPPLFITIWFQQPTASHQICCLDFWGKYFLNISKFNIFPTTEWQEQEQEEEGRLLSTQLSGEQQQQQQQDGFRPGEKCSQLLKGVDEVSRNTIFREGIYLIERHYY